MSDSETARRHLAAESGVDPERIQGAGPREDWPALLSAAAQRSCRCTCSYDGDLSLSKLRAQSRQLARRHDRLGLVVVAVALFVFSVAGKPVKHRVKQRPDVSP
jgi:replicative DNA helicase